jgi:hypothetical protein
MWFRLGIDFADEALQLLRVVLLGQLEKPGESVLEQMGEGIEWVRRAMRLNPLSSFFNSIDPSRTSGLACCGKRATSKIPIIFMSRETPCLGMKTRRTRGF